MLGALVALVIVAGGAAVSALEIGPEKAKAETWDELLSSHSEVLGDRQIKLLERMIARMLERGICTVPTVGTWDWSFRSSALFVWTVISTIGYGFFAPATWAGKLFTCVLGFTSIGFFQVQAESV